MWKRNQILISLKKKKVQWFNAPLKECPVPSGSSAYKTLSLKNVVPLKTGIVDKYS